MKVQQTKENNMYRKTMIATFMALQLCSMNVMSSETEELIQLRNTTLNLIEMLVEQGVLDREKANELVQRAEQAASVQAVEQTKQETEQLAPNTVRVPYVPETVKQSIRDEVRTGLREDVSADILAKAKQERWGLPGVVPTWVDHITLYGDLRLRGQTDMFPSENTAQTYYDYQAINNAGSILGAGENATLNTTEDRERLRIRARLGLKAKITNEWTADVGLATGNLTDPVSTNQTLGNYNRNFQVVLEKAYLKYKSRTDYYTFWGGRMPNPWLHTDLVWDGDLNFDGLAAKLQFSKTDNPLDVDENQIEPYLTFGAFPLAESNLHDEKWLLGMQTGFDWQFQNQSKVRFAIAYYDYQNIEGTRNPPGDPNSYNYTAPTFLQNGNSLFNIADTSSSPNSRLMAHATDYNLLNVTISYDMARFAPIHYYLTLDYVKNLGYEINEDARMVDSTLVGSANYANESTGYQIQLDVGWPNVKERGNWRAWLAYKYLERDATLAAFTDSDFHLGGTDAKGYILGGAYGINENVWLDGRWISSEVINGEQFAVDPSVATEDRPFKVNTIQINLNAKF